MYGKGDIVWVEENSHPYKCKVTDTNVDSIQVHFIRFNKKFDFWIKRDDPRITANPSISTELPIISSSQPAGTATGLAVETRSSRKRRNSDSEVNMEDNRVRKRSHVESFQISALNDVNISHDELSGGQHDNGSGANGTADLEGTEAAMPTSDSPTSPATTVLESSLSPSPVEVPVAGAAHEGTPVEPILAERVCALCSCTVGSVVVKCELCMACFHPEQLCVGVGDAVIRELLSGRGAINYTCCACRGRRSQVEGHGQSDVVTQMLGIMGAVVSEVRKLSAKSASSVDREASNVTGPAVGTVQGSIDSRRPVQGRAISGEIRELYEREKRKSSVILRGSNISSKETAEGTFRLICEHLNLGDVNWVGVVRVNQGVWRGNIEDPEVRLKLLSEAPRLRSTSDYRQTYIQKDLTWWQRKELKDRRASSRLTGANAVQVGSRDQVSEQQRNGSSGQSSTAQNQSGGERTVTGGVFERSHSHRAPQGRASSLRINNSDSPRESNVFPSRQLRGNFLGP